MNHTRNITRRSTRRLDRPLSRCLTRTCLRRVMSRRRGPDDLSQSLTAFTRAIRCHRRLARLAPNFFDATTVDRAARQRGEDKRWMAIWKPALDKVYGDDPTDDPTPDPTTESPPLPGIRTQSVVERELAGWDLWMSAGRAAFERHHQRRPHTVPTLPQLARLLRIAFEFKELACGWAADDPPSESPNYSRVLGELERAHNQRRQPATNPAPVTPVPHPPPATSPSPAVPPASPIPRRL